MMDDLMDRMAGLLDDAIYEYHVYGSIRDHHDPKDTSGWNVHGIETCEDGLCVEARKALQEYEERKDVAHQ